ncbi:uncharacterized protein LOC134283831 [Saccostrea cucullata]|uniref:uncharacterized protein LOC134283831 n=1 Tax=Saccostrea cuccullata TaxID=36930 RepID=UPI002ED2624D
MQSKILTGNFTFKSLKPPDLSNCTKRELCEYFENSYDLNESLFTALKDDSVFYKCPDRLRLPLIFYFCHTAVVYVNKLMLAGLITERVNLEFETMFETGVDEMSWDDTENYRMGGSYKWPSVDSVVEYRRNVRNVVLKAIHDTPLELPVTMESPWWAILMGIEHERIHLETSSVLIRQLPVELVTKPKGWVYAPYKCGGRVEENPLISVEAQDIKFGKPKEFPSYGWDNEYGEFSTRVPAFEASKFMITNGEFLEFVESGGYEDEKFWTEEGWKWKEYRQSKHPVFWVCNHGCKGGCGADLSQYSHCHLPNTVSNGVMNGSLTNGHSREIINGGEKKNYMYRAMFDVLPMPLDWPVDVNYHQARAFCAWKGFGFRLPTEAERNVMKGNKLMKNGGTDGDIIYQKKPKANINLQYGSSTPVNMYPGNELGFHDIFGNVWEWAEDHFNGLDGYDSHWFYDDFSSPCFDGRHNLILGGSWIATGDEASKFARFAFRRHFIQHAGFRMARSLQQSDKVDVPARLIKDEVFVLGVGVEEKEVPNEDEMEFKWVPTTNYQYGFDTEDSLYGILEMEFGFRDSFPHCVAHHCLSLQKSYKCDPKSALWLGSGAGRGPLELTTVFQNVLGVDFAARFIDAAEKLQNGKTLTYKTSNGEQKMAAMTGVYKPDQAVFKQMTWIPNEICNHDMTIVTFLDRTMNAKAWLARLWEITVKLGIVVIVSKQAEWNQENLAPFLGNKLVLKETKDLKYKAKEGELTAQVTVWQRQ